MEFSLELMSQTENDVSYLISFRIDHYSEKDAEEIYQLAKRLRVSKVSKTYNTYFYGTPILSNPYGIKEAKSKKDEPKPNL